MDVLTSDDTAQQLQRENSKWRRKNSPETAYALTLLHLQANRLDKASTWMQELSSRVKEHPTVSLLEAELKAAKGDSSGSQKQLKTLHALFPERFSILEVLLDQVIDERQLSEAKTLATNYLRRTDNPHPSAYRTLANVQQQLGEVAASHEMLAYYFAEYDEYERAANQLELALRHIAPGSQDELRLRASLDVVRGVSPR